MKEIKIQFATEAAALHFATWLCEAGEQDYWNWMDCRDDPANTVASFGYHGAEDESKAENDPARYRGFLGDWTIRAAARKAGER
jgi:hypothetical protein